MAGSAGSIYAPLRSIISRKTRKADKPDATLDNDEDHYLNIREIAGLAPVIPVLTINELKNAIPLANALVAGGLRVLEVTLRSPVAFAAVEAVRKWVPEAIVGIGTLTCRADFAAADRAGAQFAVTPGLTSETAVASGDFRFPLLPGIMTPTELMVARNAGFKVLELFPAQQAGGVSMLKALHAPFPDVKFCPTGGVTRATAADYLRLPNVVCVGGSWVAPSDMVDRADWAGIEALAREAAELGAQRNCRYFR